MQAWLGLSYVDAAALWSLFVAFGASIIQVGICQRPIPANFFKLNIACGIQVAPFERDAAEQEADQQATRSSTYADLYAYEKNVYRLMLA